MSFGDVSENSFLEEFWGRFRKLIFGKNMANREPIMEEHLNKFDDCLQHEVSFCTAACPFNLDVNTFITRLQEGRFNAAYKAYRDATGFPEIAAMLCTEECKGSCLRNAVAGGTDAKAADPIELLKLEKAVLEHSTRKEPVNYNIPSKHKSVAIIGAGISGMACALRMATKKYKVTIFEKSDRTGGALMKGVAEAAERIQADFALQMQHLDYDIRFNTEIKSLDEILRLGYEDNKAAAEGAVSPVSAVMRSRTTNASRNYEGTYDAIYIATGAGGPDFGVAAKADSANFGGPCLVISHKYNSTDTAVFLGGMLTGADPIHALADGLRISTAIDNYTLTGILKYPVYPETEIQIDETHYLTTKTVTSADKVYTKEEAVKEAKRCMKCQCSACRLHCDLTEYLHKWPLRIKDEIIATTAPGRSELHATPAVRLINSCTHCGLCKQTCPSDIDIDGLIQSARVRMHKLGKMPWAFNDFFLRDMAFTNSDAAYFCEMSPGDVSENSFNTTPGAAPKYLFFPGCQLGASEPELVIKAYEWLLNQSPASGIMLSCCGIPAQWAGDEDLRDEVLARIRQNWEKTGKPVLVLACPTCRNTFARQLPEIETVFLYELMAEKMSFGKRPENSPGSSLAFAVFDPCATEQDEPVRNAIRNITRGLNIKTEPLPIQEKWSACCSFGGHGILADPEFTKFVRNNRIRESNLPYITYCINCRDSFLHEGKQATHILNLIFGTQPKTDTITQRRENRIRLKETLMKDYFNTSPRGDSKPTGDSKEASKDAMVSGDSGLITLTMSDEVRHKLSEEFILEHEAADAVSFCEKTGRTLLDQEKNSYIGYRKIGNLTYWVEYRKTNKPDCFELLNAYTHRMTIDLEMIWNGHKIDIHE
ncbi:MAG: FAD-dependent oxidoreductase [Eubacteriales bacterium]|nr:FAD-dependent oxidoreductase [Eubacteriales bacterium]